MRKLGLIYFIIIISFLAGIIHSRIIQKGDKVFVNKMSTSLPPKNMHQLISREKRTETNRSTLRQKGDTCYNKEISYYIKQPWGKVSK